MSFQQEKKEIDLIRSNIHHNRKKNGCYGAFIFIFLLFICMFLYSLTSDAAVESEFNTILLLLFITAITGSLIYAVYFNWKSKKEANGWLEAHGREVVVAVTNKIIDPSQKDGEGVPAHFFELTWVDPSSGKSRSLKERVDVVRYERYRIGAHLMMSYDTYDPSFHEVRWYR